MRNYTKYVEVGTGLGDKNMEIKEALKILLTPDGKGKRKKACVLRELCDTCNANLVRDEINKLLVEMLDDDKFL